jgi:pimeloyl-ACP methyl ester carboxylesterase
MWDNQFHYFTKYYRCIRIDLRGFGQSALPGNEPYSYQDDLKTLLNALEISDPVILVGHSIGGKAAINFALRYPRYTKALILANTEIEGYAFKDFKIEPIHSSAQKKSIEYARRKWITHELFAPARKNKLLAECLDQMIHFYSGWHFVSGDSLVALTPSPWDRLQAIHVPTLIINGELDLPDFKEIGETAAAVIPGAKRAVLPHTGYLCNMESPVLFNKELKQFLESVTAD